MSSSCVISAVGVSKRYQLYSAPHDRLKQFVVPRLQRAMGMDPSQYYQDFTSLSDVSFEVNAGETLGIVGKNGAGKSTLLQILCGTVAPTEGSVTVKGRVAALLELGAGFNPEFTGRDNVFMNARLLGLTEQQIEERFESITAFADIGGFLDQPVKTYSSGMYVRLAFAVIAHVDADILVIDEALAVGDAYFSQKCMRFLREFKSRGTLLFVSHDASAVVNLCDRALWLDRGKLAKQGVAKEVMEEYLADLYGGGVAPVGSPSSVPLPASKSPPPVAAPIGNRVATLALTPDRGSGGARRFGTNLAHVARVALLDSAGGRLASVLGLEAVTLEVCVVASVELDAPIVGFIVKDRLGQHLFGDNTFLRYASAPVRCHAGQGIRASFTFTMPILPRGEYSIAVAIANGTQEVHVVHEWLHEALIFQSHSSSVVTGLVGIPMLGVEVTEEPNLQFAAP